ncbi:carboxypeptidase A inhibitor [Trichuris suis]|nr:carboxypeptidase A inhibitor [Trichuris suis]
MKRRVQVHQHTVGRTEQLVASSHVTTMGYLLPFLSTILLGQIWQINAYAGYGYGYSYGYPNYGGYTYGNGYAPAAYYPYQDYGGYYGGYGGAYGGGYGGGYGGYGYQGYSQGYGGGVYPHGGQEVPGAPPGAAGCTASDSCPNDQICISQQCIPGIPSKTKCTSDADCAGGGCKYEYCWHTDQGQGAPGQPGQAGPGGETPTPGDGTQPGQEGQQPGQEGQQPGQEGQQPGQQPQQPGQQPQQPGQQPQQPQQSKSCTTQDECPGNQICSDVHKNFCTNGYSIGVPCKVEKDCKKKDVCKAGTCWREGDDTGKPAGSECKGDDECKAMTVCEDKQCKPAMITTKKCMLETQCGKSQACHHGYCWSVTSDIAQDNSMKPCTSHNECDPQSICSELHANRCMKAHSIGVPCTQEKDCSKKDVCKGGYCWKEGADQGSPAGSQCKKDEQCAATLVCEGKVCKQSQITQKKCTFEAQCGKNSACRYGYCWSVSG